MKEFCFMVLRKEKQGTGVDFAHSSLLRIAGLSNKITSQNILLYCTVLF